MTFEVTLLGTSAAIPYNNRGLSAQILNVHEHLYMIDCGEGTQMRMQHLKIKRNRIRQIFISHLHGDHYYGLFGVLTSFSMVGRTEPLSIYAPAGLQEIIDVMIQYSGMYFSYPLDIQIVDTTRSRWIFEDDVIQVKNIPLTHRIPCSGYLFKEKAMPANILPEMISAYNIPYTAINAIKKGADFICDNGVVIPNNLLVIAAHQSRSYAYCADTAYDESIIPIIQGVDLLYHETTFLDDMADYAKIAMHSTAKEAAMIAQKAKVKKLLTGHYSARYNDLNLLLEDAKTVFPNTLLGIDGERYNIS